MNRRSAPASARLAALAVVMVAVVAVAACGHLTAAPTMQSGQDLSGAVVTGTSGDLTCLAPAKPAPRGGCMTTDAATGISLRVAGGYTDVTGTLVKLVAANAENYPLDVTPQLALRSGYVLRSALGGYMSWPDSMIVDEPLRPQDFAPRVELIASASFAEAAYFGGHEQGPPTPPTPHPTPPWLHSLDHLAIRVPFTLSPARGAALTYHMPPTVQRGVGVQVQALDVSPSRDAFFGQAGGARVELRFSGLPADLELLSFIRVKSERTLPDGGTAGDRGPGLLTLRIPGMTLGGPVMTLLQSPIYPDNRQTPDEPTVGPAGTVAFEAAFAGSGTPTGAPATLTISSIQRITSGTDPTTTIPPTLPDYQITLPMR